MVVGVVGGGAVGVGYDEKPVMGPRQKLRWGRQRRWGGEVSAVRAAGRGACLAMAPQGKGTSNSAGAQVQPSYRTNMQSETPPRQSKETGPHHSSNTHGQACGLSSMRAHSCLAQPLHSWWPQGAMRTSKRAAMHTMQHSASPSSSHSSPPAGGCWCKEGPGAVEQQAAGEEGCWQGLTSEVVQSLWAPEPPVVSDRLRPNSQREMAGLSITEVAACLIHAEGQASEQVCEAEEEVWGAMVSRSDNSFD